MLKTENFCICVLMFICIFVFIITQSETEKHLLDFKAIKQN